MRLIDADKLKETIKSPETFTTIPVKKHMCKIIDNSPTAEYPFYQEAYQTGYEEGKNERPEGKWIPVSERLPEEKTKVLITNDKGEVDLIRWDTWWQNQTVYPNHIRAIAWQPLPEPYKKGDED